MSDTSEYVPKVGDEVEVVLRGKVTEVRPRDGYVIIGNPAVMGSVALDLSAPHIVSVTRVRKPLPTEPDHVVAVNGVRWVLEAHGMWWSTNDETMTPATMAEQDWRIVSVPVQEGHKVLDRDCDAVQDGEV